MTVLVMIGYYLFAFAVLGWVAYSTGQRNNRLFREAADEAIAHLHASSKPVPPLPPYVPEPIPGDDELKVEDEYADTIASVREQLAELADHGYPVTNALEEVTALARRVGV